MHDDASWKLASYKVEDEIFDQWGINSRHNAPKVLTHLPSASSLSQGEGRTQWLIFELQSNFPIIFKQPLRLLLICELNLERNTYQKLSITYFLQLVDLQLVSFLLNGFFYYLAKQFWKQL